MTTQGYSRVLPAAAGYYSPGTLESVPCRLSDADTVETGRAELLRRSGDTFEQFGTASMRAAIHYHRGLFHKDCSMRVRAPIAAARRRQSVGYRTAPAAALRRIDPAFS